MLFKKVLSILIILIVTLTATTTIANAATLSRFTVTEIYGKEVLGISAAWTEESLVLDLVGIDLNGIVAKPSEYFQEELHVLSKRSKDISLIDLKEILKFLLITKKEEIDSDAVDSSIVNNQLIVRAIQEGDLEKAKKIWIIHALISRYAQGSEMNLGLYASRTEMAIEAILLEEKSLTEAARKAELFRATFAKNDLFIKGCTATHLLFQDSPDSNIGALSKAQIALGAFGQAIKAKRLTRALEIKERYQLAESYPEEYEFYLLDAAVSLAEEYFKTGDRSIYELRKATPVPEFNAVLAVPRSYAIWRIVTNDKKNLEDDMPEVTPEQIRFAFALGCDRYVMYKENLEAWHKTLIKYNFDPENDPEIVKAVKRVAIVKLNDLEDYSEDRMAKTAISTLQELYGLDQDFLDEKKKQLQEIRKERVSLTGQ